MGRSVGQGPAAGQVSCCRIAASAGAINSSAVFLQALLFKAGNRCCGCVTAVPTFVHPRLALQVHHAVHAARQDHRTRAHICVCSYGGNSRRICACDAAVTCAPHCKLQLANHPASCCPAKRSHLGPYTSASMSPTRRPCRCASATARLTAGNAGQAGVYGRAS